MESLVINAKYVIHIMYDYGQGEVQLLLYVATVCYDNDHCLICFIIPFSYFTLQ